MCWLNSLVKRTPFPRARSSITRSMRFFTLAVTGSLLIHPVETWAAPLPPSRPLGERLYATEKSLIDFRKGLFALQEAAEGPTPHVEILVDLDSAGAGARAQSPARRVDTLVEIDSGSDSAAHSLAFPGWIRIALDDVPPVEHAYSEKERRALAEGGLQSLLTAPFTAGRHTLAITLKGSSQNGRRYSMTKGFTFETTRPAVHVVLRVLPPSSDEPQVMLDVLERAWLEPLPSGTADDPVYRLGIFACGVGDFDTAASLLLASLDRPAPIRPDRIRLRLSEAFAEMGLSEEAEAMLNTIASQTSDEVTRAHAWLLMERIAFRGGRHSTAIEAYERVDFARVGSALPLSFLDEAHLAAGTSATLLHQYPRAVAAFRRVARSGPDAPLALYGEAQAFVGAGDAFSASTLFKQLTESRPPPDLVRARVTDFAQVALGYESLEQGQYEEALSDFGRVRPDHPAYETALFGIGWAFRKMGEHVKAIVIFQDLISRFPHGEHVHEARLAMAASYGDLRAYTRAVTAYRSALEASMASLYELDQRRDAVENQTWDPLADRFAEEGAYPTHEAIVLSQSLNRYRWLLHGEEDLRRTLDHLSTSLPRAQGKDFGPGSGAHFVAEGRTLLVKADAIKEELRGTLKSQVRKALDHDQQRLEECSVRASVGIAKNLIADRDDVGSGALTFD